jgi:hypothetical protein
LLAAIIVVPVVILGATLADNLSALISASQKLYPGGSAESSRLGRERSGDWR